MKTITKLSALYADAIWGIPSHEHFNAWALDTLCRNEDEADVDVACLASAQDEHESLALVRCILAKRDFALLNQLEPDASSLPEAICRSFPNNTPSQKITACDNNDPSDYRLLYDETEHIIYLHF